MAYCTVDPWGNVRPCNHAPLICGNLLERSIEEIWQGAAMNRWRGMIAEQCWHCQELPRCHGGCRAVAMLQGVEKDPLMRSPILEKDPEPCQELTLYEGARPVGRYVLRAEEFGYVLEGRIQLTVDGDSYPLGAGDCYHIPAVSERDYRVDGSSSAQLLWVQMGAGSREAEAVWYETIEKTAEAEGPPVVAVKARHRRK